MDVTDAAVRAGRRPAEWGHRLTAPARALVDSARERMAALPYDYPPSIIVTADVILLLVSGAAVVQRHEYFPTLLPFLAMATVFLPVPLFAIFGVRPHPILLKACGLASCALFLLQPVDADFAPFVLVVVAGEVAAIAARGAGIGFALVAIAELVAFDLAGKLHWGPDAQRLQGLPMYVMGIVLGTSVGVMLQYQRRFLYQERENQTIRADRAAADERRRIAREVHDVIAHSLSITLLHLTAARHALQTDADVDEAVDALVDAERLGRQAMADIRRTVGMLDAGPASTTAEPGAGDLDELVGDFRRAGLTVDYSRSGDLELVTGAVGLALYRIGQESLANVAKHAPGAPAAVRLVVDEDHATLTVTNELPLGPPLPAGDGMGLRGMRQRAELLGGRIAAGRDAGGWAVRAGFPLRASSCSTLSGLLPGLGRHRAKEDL
ncbi:sensor histidine kinase [Nocardia thailandica]|uniref:sensor histidine kinase n=1 Tax=Nocardia thailandica TaxID=257275 RepID=UPI0003095230|nr:histidine kinase [Nocardia thailandica]